jgi:hypothetical protein
MYRRAYKTKQALPLPRGRILRFARCRANALAVANKSTHIRASRHASKGASSSASSTASLVANHAASLMLRYP